MGLLFVTEQTTLRLHTKQKGRHHKAVKLHPINQTKQKVKNTMIQPFFSKGSIKQLGKNGRTLVT